MQTELPPFQLIFKKKNFPTQYECEVWLLDNGFAIGKMKESKQQIKYTQFKMIKGYLKSSQLQKDSKVIYRWQQEPFPKAISEEQLRCNEPFVIDPLQ